jgi:hypothetical protein
MNSISEKYALRHWEDIQKAQKYTFRFLVNHKEYYKVHGCGVFVNIDERYFILTAAHVIDLRDDLMIPLGDELLRPGGKIKFSNFTKTRESDFLDIAFMELDEFTVSELKKQYNFLTKENISINHNTQNSLMYTFLGYPSTFSKFSKTTQSFHSNVFFHYNKPESDEVYKNLSRNPTTNIIIKYDRKKALNTRKVEITNGPDLYGMSGCGLWFTDPIDIFKKVSEPKLVAIMTDWPIKNRNTVVGTKMQVFSQALKQEFGIDF